MTTMEVKSIFKTSGAPAARSMATSLALHVFVLGGLMLIPAQLLLRSEPSNKELDIVFYRPPEIAVKPRAVSLPTPRGTTAAGGSPPGAPAPALKPKPNSQGDERGRILVSIDEAGGLWINDQLVAAEHFGEALQAAVGAEPDPRVVIRGDAKLKFFQVREAMLAIEQAGFRGVGLIAKRTGAEGK